MGGGGLRFAHAVYSWGCPSRSSGWFVWPLLECVLPIPDPTPDDGTLMERIATGDESALSIFYERYKGLVFALCLRVLRDRGEAEDVLVEVFFEMWDRASRFDPGRGSPRTYLMTLTRSRAIDRQRARRVRGGPLVADAAQADREGASGSGHGTSASGGGGREAGPGEAAVASESRELVRRAVSELDDAQREAVELAFFDGLTHREIAQRLDTPLGTIKSRVRLGLVRLRDSLERLYRGEEEQ